MGHTFLCSDQIWIKCHDGNWIEVLWCDANFHKCGNLQCIFHLNHLVNLNLIWTCNRFCSTIHHIYNGIFGWIIFVHSDFSLNHKHFYYIYMLVNSMFIVKNLIKEINFCVVTFFCNYYIDLQGLIWDNHFPSFPVLFVVKWRFTITCLYNTLFKIV